MHSIETQIISARFRSRCPLTELYYKTLALSYLVESNILTFFDNTIVWQ